MLRKLFVVLGCIHLLGGSYGVLQMIAWTGMLVSYTQSEGLATGVAQTFDGKHPCSLCTAIQDAKEEDRDQQPLGPTHDNLSLKLAALPAPTLLRRPCSRPAATFPFVEPSESHPEISFSPPSPPPRFGV